MLVPQDERKLDSAHGEERGSASRTTKFIPKVTVGSPKNNLTHKFIDF
jgi:hypothetical protein